MYAIQRCLTQVYDVCDYIPFISTAKGLIELFRAYVFTPLESGQPILPEHEYTHLKSKDFSRHLTILLPVIGNIMVAYSDFNNYQEKTPIQQLKTLTENFHCLEEKPKSEKDILQQEDILKQIATILKSEPELIGISVFQESILGISVEYSNECVLDQKNFNFMYDVITILRHLVKENPGLVKNIKQKENVHEKAIERIIQSNPNIVNYWNIEDNDKRKMFIADAVKINSSTIYCLPIRDLDTDSIDYFIGVIEEKGKSRSRKRYITDLKNLKGLSSRSLFKAAVNGDTIKKRYDRFVCNGLLRGFYNGQGKDIEKRTIDDILSWNNEKLEGCHDCIQWLFPTNEESKYNFKIPILTQELVNELKRDERVVENFRKAFDKMLNFYGYQNYDSESVKVEKADNFEERSAKWCTLKKHNFLRITRIIKSLSLMGLEKEATSFWSAMLEVALNSKDVDNETARHWQEAIGHQFEQSKLK